MQLNRRQFLGKTTTAVLVAGTIAKGKVFGANNRIGVCTIGFNGQGGGHIKDILQMKGEAEYVALCDVDANVRERGAKTVESAQGKAPRLYKDIREAMEESPEELESILLAAEMFVRRGWPVRARKLLEEPCLHHPKPNGTVSIYSALSCLPYIPEQVTGMILHLYHDHPKTWGKYGFFDSYNLAVSPPWYSHSLYGIDKGCSMIMIENHLSRLVWETYTNSPYIQKGLAVLGFTKREVPAQQEGPAQLESPLQQVGD